MLKLCPAKHEMRNPSKDRPEQEDPRSDAKPNLATPVQAAAPLAKSLAIKTHASALEASLPLSLFCSLCGTMTLTSPSCFESYLPVGYVASSHGKINKIAAGSPIQSHPPRSCALFGSGLSGWWWEVGHFSSSKTSFPNMNHHVRATALPSKNMRALLSTYIHSWLNLATNWLGSLDIIGAMCCDVKFPWTGPACPLVQFVRAVTCVSTMCTLGGLDIYIRYLSFLASNAMLSFGIFCTICCMLNSIACEPHSNSLERRHNACGRHLPRSL